MDNKTLILQEFERLKGQFVITDSHTIERLIAIGQDDQDYYYLTYDGRKIRWHSCVGRNMQLKDRLADKDYNELVRLAKLNHFDQLIMGNKDPEKLKEFTETHKKEVLIFGEHDSLLTEVCWDLN